MITIVGSLNMDMVTKTERMPKVGETIIGSSFEMVPGGKGANQADSAAKLGGDARIIGRVGEDVFGESLLKSLSKDGVDITYVKKTKGSSTGAAAITVNSKGDNSIVVIPGANFKLEEEDIDHAEEIIKQSEIVIAQNEVPMKAIIRAFEIAKKHRRYTILNPAPAIKLSEKILPLIDLLVPNEIEIELLSERTLKNEKDIIQAGGELIVKGIKEIIVTLGERGCIYINSHEVSSYPSYKVDVVDTTAAGDSFIGSLAVALAEGKTMKDAIVFATRASALTVTRMGAQTSLPSREEVENFSEQR